MDMVRSVLLTPGVLTVSSIELNTMEILPPNFDDSGRTKYPVLFWVYVSPVPILRAING